MDSPASLINRSTSWKADLTTEKEKVAVEFHMLLRPGKHRLKLTNSADDVAMKCSVTVMRNRPYSSGVSGLISDLVTFFTGRQMYWRYCSIQN
jgi:hypothetical protein